MTPSSAIPSLDYDRLRATLADAGAVVTLPELHGGVCGALCVGGTPAARRWLTDCLDDSQLDVGAAGVPGDLEELVTASTKMLVNRELEFEPLLPGDDEPLAEQVQALALWCHGFLGGVAATAPNAGRDLAAEPALEEIFGDFAEISRAGLSEDEAAGKDAPDFALAELHEYVRVSVQIVFEELGLRRRAAPPDLH